MGSMSAPKQKESESEKALAEVAEKNWELFKNELQPLEGAEINRVKALGEGAEKEQLIDRATVGLRAEGYTKPQGLDPNSGSAFMTNVNQENALARDSAATAVNAGNLSDDRYYEELARLVSRGQGKHMEVSQGLRRDAIAGHRSAAESLQNKMSNRSSNMEGLGHLTGMGYSAYKEGKFDDWFGDKKNLKLA